MSITFKDRKFHINFEEMRRTGIKGVHRASAFAGFSLNAAARDDLKDFHPAGAYWRWLPENFTDEQVADYKSAYRTWVTGNAIRELVESFGNFLNGIYGACCLMDSDNIPFAELHSRHLKFEMLSEYKRMKRLKAEFGIRPPFYDHLKSLITVRNAITHRWGQVKEPELVVLWRRMRPSIKHPDGTETIVPLPMQVPLDTGPGGRLVMKPVDATKTFKAGQFVNFEPHELQEICWVFEQSIGHLLGEAQRKIKKSEAAPDAISAAAAADPRTIT